MKKLFALFLFTLLLCGCSNAVNGIVWGNGERNGKNVSLIRGEDIKKIYGSEVGGLTWVDGNRFIIETVTGFDASEEVEDSRESIFFLSQLGADQIETIYKKKDSNVLAIYDSYLSGSRFAAAKQNGDILRFENWKHEGTEESGQHELSTIRDIQSNTLYYFDGQYMMKKKDGEQAQSIYQLYEDDAPGKEMIYPRALTLSPDKKKLAFAVLTDEVDAEKTVIIDLETGDVREIQKSMAMPEYFWMGDQFFALTNDETKTDTVAKIFYGENFENSVERVVGNGICQLNPRHSSHENGVPLTFIFTGNDSRDMREIVLLRPDLSLETVYSNAGVGVRYPCLSPDGTKLLFHEYSLTDDTSSVVVMDL